MCGAVRVRGGVAFGVWMRFCAADRAVFAGCCRYRRDNDRKTGDDYDGVADEGRRNCSRSRVG